MSDEGDRRMSEGSASLDVGMECGFAGTSSRNDPLTNGILSAESKECMSALRRGAHETWAIYKMCQIVGLKIR